MIHILYIVYGRFYNSPRLNLIQWLDDVTSRFALSWGMVKKLKRHTKLYVYNTATESDLKWWIESDCWITVLETIIKSSESSN